MIPGGLTKIDTNDAEVQEVAAFATSQIRRQTNDNVQLIQVVRAWVQVVAGLKYHLELKMSNGMIKVEVVRPLSATNGKYELISWNPIK